MAYEFDEELISDDLFTDALGTEISEFTLGFDLERDIAVVMSVMLVPIDEAYDLRFGIREKDLAADWRVSAPDYTKETVALYVPKGRRELVMIKLLASVVEVVGSKSPNLVTMETYYSDLPQCAMQKYAKISEAIHSCGYYTTDHFRHGTTHKDHWFFTKSV